MNKRRRKNVKDVRVTWNGGSTRFSLAGNTEEELWKPVGQIAGAASRNKGNDMITVIVDDRDTAQVIVENGTVKPGDNKIRLRKSRYPVRKLRKIDPETGAHQFYDLVPNNMGPRTMDVGARFGQTGGTNAGADMVEGAFVLKKPMPSWMYWAKYHQLLENGYADYTDDIYDEEEEIRRLEKMFEGTTPASDEDELVLKINDFFEDASKNCLAQLNIDFLSSRLPFNYTQVNSAWREWKKFGQCLRAKDANEIISKLLAITNASFKDENGKKKSLSSFYIRESDPNTEKQAIEKASERWESIINSMEAVLPLKMEKGKKVVSPFGNIEMEMATHEEKERWLKKFRAPRDLAYRVVNVNAPDFLERTETYAKAKGIGEAGFDYFIHGSRTENWKSLTVKGPLIHADAIQTGKAYDWGIYTARDLVKSLGYTSLSGSKWAYGDQPVGVIGIYKCAYGKPYYPTRGRYGIGYRDAVINGGYNCLDAKTEYSGYRMDEIVFYEEPAMCLVGLIFIANDEAGLDAIGLTEKKEEK